MAKTQRCSSCRVGLATEENWSQFKCPSCAKHDIFRCDGCRRQSVIYKCKCGFEGP